MGGSMVNLISGERVQIIHVHGSKITVRFPDGSTYIIRPSDITYGKEPNLNRKGKR
jgi:hypothetical protein